MDQLKETVKIIDWGIKQIPKERLLEIPPHGTHPQSTDYDKRYFGNWSAYRILFHLVLYEEYHVIPSLMKFINAQEDISGIDLDEEVAWKNELIKGVNVDGLLMRLNQARNNQIDIIKRIDDNKWTADTGHTSCMHSSPEFITSKTIQHTLEHGNKILRIALFWDRLLHMLDQREKT
ncbi:MAG: hypothetical protein FK733_08555 [Asgard group archaeon]|nr:hypothetical protein [Asgard group archaeon]